MLGFKLFVLMNICVVSYSFFVFSVEGDVRIVRSCATWPDETKANRCVDRTGTHKIKVRYCECDGDDCNGSSRIYGSLSLFLATLLSLLVANSMCR